MDMIIFHLYLIPNHYPENIKSYESINNIIVNQLIGLGFNEVVNNSILSPTSNNLKKEIDESKSVDILNPIGTEISQMRNSLLFGLLENISYNLKRQEQNIKIFETGKVYLNDKGEFIENKYVSISLTSDFTIKIGFTITSLTFFKVKGIVNSILVSSLVLINVKR